ncbi:UNKNOWN [Stylonychia lemnae]|uniref:Uncharacterized protein n=1 Tax=Stylonychia lemnae TaxID=5949 RepID=A0A077ZQS3_STYLE|nr:UNKNOWN [Stylonychia lemnae]|eukprot:CDW72252.1 UNKNOWN [Stylonychia lemnae]
MFIKRYNHLQVINTPNTPHFNIYTNDEVYELQDSFLDCNSFICMLDFQEILTLDWNEMKKSPWISRTLWTGLKYQAVNLSFKLKAIYVDIWSSSTNKWRVLILSNRDLVSYISKELQEAQGLDPILNLEAENYQSLLKKPSLILQSTNISIDDVYKYQELFLTYAESKIESKDEDLEIYSIVGLAFLSNQQSINKILYLAPLNVQEAGI